MARKKSWREKLADSKDLPKVQRIEGKMSRRWGKGTVAIPAPKDVDALMRKVRKGKLEDHCLRSFRFRRIDIRGNTRQQFVEHRTERVYVGTFADLVATSNSLFKSHVGRGANRLSVESEVRRLRRVLTRRLVVADCLDDRYGLIFRLNFRRRFGWLRVLVTENLGQTPIHHEDFAELPDHDVVGLQVTMDDAL